MRETRKRGIRATEEGRQKLTTAKAAKRNHNDKVWTYLDIATEAGVHETTVKRFFGGDGVDRESAISICKALDLEVTDIVDPKELNPPTSTTTPTEIDWRDICNQVLATQQLRRPATAQQYELNIYVPLGLMERPKLPPNPRPEPTGEESQPQKEPELQIVQTYKDDAFFQKVIAENRTENHKHIAIIGEPGAGKTTLLGELAERLIDLSPNPSPGRRGENDSNSCSPSPGRRGENDSNSCSPYPGRRGENDSNSCSPYPGRRGENDSNSCSPFPGREGGWGVRFPICIRLADLRDSTIADYLLNNWLSKALQFIDYDAENVTPEIKKALKQLFAEGKVWLLLDGVDEMAATSPVEALARIREQLTDWVGKARVVLTCRLNVWDAAISNTLTNFDTYKTLEFEPDDVDEFIRQWFEEASQDEKRRNSGNETFWREQGKRLQQQLKAPGKERIRELVRNPLRLSMLCQSWCVPEQDLPETKAALYEQFTTYFFEWKQEEFQKKHRVLKEKDKKQIQQALAKLALAAMESANRFRIEQDFAIEQMEEEWFDLAGELGWLVLVDRDNRTKKPVYAFFHPTFQEYFAACAIGDWHFFLNHQIPPVSSCSYRVFEKQWREVILLWLGRGEIEGKQKQEFIDALVNFEDGCGDFYGYRAYFLAAAAIAEFQDYSQIDEVIGEIVRCGFGYFDSEKQEWRSFLYVISDAAREALQQTHPPKAIDALVQLLTSPNLKDDTRRDVAESLEKIDPGNQKAIDALVQLLNSPNLDDDTHRRVAESLEKIDPGNQKAIDALVQLLTSPNLDDSTRRDVAETLWEIGKGNQKAIDALIQQLNSTHLDDDTRWRVAVNLGKIDPGNQKAIDVLVQQLNSTHLDDDTRWRVAVNLGNIGQGNPKAIDALVQLLISPAVDDFTRGRVAYSLGEIGQGNPKAIDALVQLLTSPNLDDKTRASVASSLGETDPGNPKAIDALVQLLTSPAVDDFTRRRVAYSLGEIGQGNPKAINTLVQLLTSPNLDDSTRSAVASNLGRIGIGIDTLVQLLTSPALDYSTRSAVAYNSLRKIDIGNQKAIDALVQLLISANLDGSTRWEVAEALEKIQTQKQLAVITALKANFNNSQQINNCCYKLIWHYAQNLSYPDFYQAWHQDTLTNSATASLNLAKFPQFLAKAINNLIRFMQQSKANLHRHSSIHRPRKPRRRNLRSDAKSKMSRVAEWVSRYNAKTQTLLELPAPPKRNNPVFHLLRFHSTLYTHRI